MRIYKHVAIVSGNLYPIGNHWSKYVKQLAAGLNFHGDEKPTAL